MSVLEIASPTRVDLAGGTLDCWPLYMLFGGATTINVPISIWTRARLEPRDSRQVSIVSHDLSLKVEVESLDEFMALTDPRLLFYQLLLGHFRPTEGFHLETRSESPVGGGLGGSSSLLMSCLKLFSGWMGLPMQPHEMVHLASNLEAQMLQKPTGTQDYYPAVYPRGINLIEYKASGVEVTPVAVPPELFTGRFLLVYTGRSHHSGINNWDVIKKALDGDTSVLKALRDIQTVATELKQKILNQDWNGWPELFARETKARLQLSPGFTSPEIERLTQLALKHGANAVKICGAGGGGCVFIWTTESALESVRSACQHEGYQVLDTKPLA